MRHTRRGMLRTLAVGVASIGLGSLPLRARPRAKASKQEVQYQDEPMDVRMCATCSLFDAPKSCKVVRGDVNPNGWCNLYSLAD